ncbi:MAG TPA: right-handed parallel beta-helix repeat-containing protein [Flavisolibacter sp.]|nr:right-handed parallel beta-helix repeat-containing protein [Flavisolibacter sp.]
MFALFCTIFTQTVQSIMMNRLYLMASAFFFFACKPAESLSKTTNGAIEPERMDSRVSGVVIPSASEKINARDFGFLPSANAATNTKALQRISTYINEKKGDVVLIINKGAYTVGAETFAGAEGKGYSYRGESLLKIEGCTKPVVIEGNGATIKLASGLHFGSFNNRTGAAHNAPAGGFYDYNYVAYPGNMIDVSNNASIVVRNLTLDGNLQQQKLGGYWGDTGIQLPADGIFGKDNGELIVENVTSRYFLRDGIHIGNTTPNEKAAVKRIFLLNSTFDGNTRQGFSWIGGNHLVATNCKFINTGKTVNAQTKKPVISAPSAGVDMEAELGLIRNGVFTNCTIDNNGGAGFLSVGDVGNIRYEGGKIIGATNWSIYGTGPKAVFEKVTIVGSPVNLRIGTGPNDADNARFNSCLITLDSTLSPTKKVYGNYVMDFGGGAGGHFINCTFESKGRGTVYGGSGCVFTNCTFKQEDTAPGYNGYPFMSGTFYGTNRLYRPGPGGMLPNLDKSKFYGPFYVNDVKVADK